MKHHRVFIFVSCIIATIWGSAPVRANTMINPGDSIFISLSGLPARTYVLVEAQINTFLGLPSATTMHMTLFSSANSLVTDGTFSFPAFTDAPIPFLNNITADNTDHLVIDQISASFIVQNIIAGAVDTNDNAVITEAAFVVTPATPLPDALPLFAAGLGVLGLLGWRRKRKASA